MLIIFIRLILFDTETNVSHLSLFNYLHHFYIYHNFSYTKQNTRHWAETIPPRASSNSPSVPRLYPLWSSSGRWRRLLQWWSKTRRCLRRPSLGRRVWWQRLTWSLEAQSIRTRSVLWQKVPLKCLLISYTAIATSLTASYLSRLSSESTIQKKNSWINDV